jgi:hypothetical protein
VRVIWATGLSVACWDDHRTQRAERRPLLRSVKGDPRRYHPGVVTEPQPEHTVAEAASAAAEETVDAIHAAAEENRDPVVAKALDDAALKADKTVSRVGWLRALLRRLVPSGERPGDDAAAGAS